MPVYCCEFLFSLLFSGACLGGQSIRIIADPDLLQGTGKDEGTLICDQKNSLGIQTVHRAHFLDELVKAVPRDRAHFHKRLERLEEGPEGVILHFQDGWTTVADVAIGADGIHGHTREYLIGDEVAKAQFSGSIVHRGLAPMKAAVDVLGEEHAHNCVMLCGPGMCLSV